MAEKSISQLFKESLKNKNTYIPNLLTASRLVGAFVVPSLFLTGNIPGSPGVPEDSIKNTLIGVYNDEKQIANLFREYGDEIAAVIIEPVAGNMGVVKAKNSFMQLLRTLCNRYGSLLIFDEVMSGFRVDFKGAQTLFNVVPDLVTYAKVMGGGLPCGAYGGKKEIMQHLSPSGDVYQAGTMSGNPIVMAAGLETLNELYFQFQLL